MSEKRLNASPPIKKADGKGSWQSGSKLPTSAVHGRAYQHITRPPLERAVSVPERHSGTNTTTASTAPGTGGGGGSTTANSSYSSSRTSIDKGSWPGTGSYNSKDGGLANNTSTTPTAPRHHSSSTSDKYVTTSATSTPPLPSHLPHYNSISAADSLGNVRSAADRYDSAEGIVWLEKLQHQQRERDRERSSGVGGTNSSNIPPSKRPASSEHVFVDSGGELMPTDENNVPQIDRAITPPPSPIRERLANGNRFTGVKRFPSLKLKRNSRMGSTRSNKNNHNDSDPNTPGSKEHNPTITITMDEDRDSIMSDYLSPDKNYKKEARIHFIGDDVSLYGTPKEELSPLKEVDSKTSSSASYLKDQIISFFQPSDNKLAMKLFGNKNALMKEKMRQKAAGNWVIHPCSNFR